MSDFIAQIKGELSLQEAEAKMQSFLNKYKDNPLKIDIGIDTSSIQSDLISQMKTVGKKTGKIFSESLASSVNISDEIAYGKELQKIQRKINKTAESMRLNIPEIDNKDAQKWATRYYKDLEKEQKRFEKNFKSVQSSILNGGYDADLSKMKSKYKSYDGQDNENLKRAAKYIDDYEKSLNNLKRHFDSNDTFMLDSDTFDKTFKSMTDSSKSFKNAMSLVGDETTKTVSAFEKMTSANKVQKYYTENTKLTKDYVDTLKDLESRMRNSSTKGDLGNLNKEFKALDSEISAKGLKGRNFFDELGRGFKQIGEFAGIYGVLQRLPDAIASSVSELKDLDSILTEISKTSELTDTQLKEMGENSFDKASKWGKKASDYLLGVQEMSRSGYQGKQAEEMANTSILAQAAGDLSADMANSYLLASNAAYQYQGNVEKLNALLDGQNMIDMVVMPCRKLMAS